MIPDPNPSVSNDSFAWPQGIKVKCDEHRTFSVASDNLNFMGFLKLSCSRSGQKNSFIMLICVLIYANMWFDLLYFV